MVTLEALLSRLSGVRRLPDGSYMALCPCHNDHKPSLHISLIDGKIIAYCFACRVTLPAVLEVLGLTQRHEPAQYVTYDYTDEAGKLLYQKVRILPKKFYCRRPLPAGGFANDLSGVRRVIYNLKAVHKADTVWVVEGEKDADRLIREGLVATTGDSGAGFWPPEYSEALRGKSLIILRDENEPGRKHQELVAMSTWKLAKNLKLLVLPGAEENQDVSDWLMEHTVEELIELAEKAPFWSPSPVKRCEVERRGSTLALRFPDFNLTLLLRGLKLHSDSSLTALFEAKLSTFRLPCSGKINLTSSLGRKKITQDLAKHAALPWDEIWEEAYQRVLDSLTSPANQSYPYEEPTQKSPAWLIDRFLPLGVETLLWGPGGAGKTWLALALGHCVVQGIPFLGRKIEKPGKVLYLDWETNAAEVARRLSIIQEGLGPTHDRKAFKYLEMTAPLALVAEQLGEVVLEFDPTLIIIDSMFRACGDLIDPAEVSKFFAAVRALARTTLIISHPSKEETLFGSAYNIWVPRSVWKLEAKTIPGSGQAQILLSHVKVNIGLLEKPIVFSLTIEPFALTLGKLEDFYEKDSIGEQILALLNTGKRSCPELARALGLPPDSLRSVLSRLRRKNLVEKDEEDRWYKPAEVPF